MPYSSVCARVTQTIAKKSPSGVANAHASPSPYVALHSSPAFRRSPHVPPVCHEEACVLYQLHSGYEKKKKSRRISHIPWDMPQGETRGDKETGRKTRVQEEKRDALAEIVKMTRLLSTVEQMDGTALRMSSLVHTVRRVPRFLGSKHWNNVIIISEGAVEKYTKLNGMIQFRVALQMQIYSQAKIKLAI